MCTYKILMLETGHLDQNASAVTVRYYSLFWSLI